METGLVISAIAAMAVLAAAVSLVIKFIKDKSALNERIMTLEKEKSVLESRLAFSEESALRTERMYSRSMEEMKRMNEEYIARSSEQHLRELDAMQERFKAAASEIVSSNSREFRERSTESISAMLAPIKEKFAELDKSMKDSRTESVRYNAELSTSIKLVMEQSRQVGDEARNLADALSGRSKVQGDFGEMLLKDILKSSGLQEGIHFSSQSVITDASGREVRSEGGAAMIPDTLIYYPDDTMVVVDSKVSLTAFNRFNSSLSAADRQKYAKEHVESIRSHVDELRMKDYASYIPEGKRKVDYNIMFIPVEGAFRLMLDEAPTLWQTAKDNNVLIVSQMTLVIVLNMIQMSWKQAAQEENIEQVYRTASELMGQLQGWMSSFVSVGDSLDRAVKSYNDSKSRLMDSRQSVIRKIEKLESLELAPKRSRARIRIASRKTAAGTIIPVELSGKPSSGEDADSLA